MFKFIKMVWQAYKTARAFDKMIKSLKSIRPPITGEVLKSHARLYGLELKEGETEPELRERILELMNTVPGIK